jgi:hypothetical protein
VGELDSVRKGEENNYGVVCSHMGDSISLIEDLIGLYELMASMVETSGVPPRDEVFAPCQFLLMDRYNLTLGALAAMRGHISDSFYFCRKAIEACAFAARIKRSPKLATDWMRAVADDSSYEKFREKFSVGKLFPQGHPLLAVLKGRYSLCCKMTHPSIISFGGHLDVQQGQSLSRVKFDYFQLDDRDPSEPIRTVLFIADTHLGILRIFEEILAPVVNHDRKKWEINLNAVDAKIGAHKNKWKATTQVAP